VARAFVVAIVGAESTGKSTLALALGAALTEGPLRVAVVPEVLREFCTLEGRPPAIHEQVDIGREQTRRIEQAAAAYDIVIADTTALMTAAYGAHYFADLSLHAQALGEQRRYDLTLLTALDLPWAADGLQRDSATARTAVDALLRSALHDGAIDHAVVSGDGPSRLANALAAVQVARRPRLPVRPAAHWTWLCPDCDDGACERHALAALHAAGDDAVRWRLS
jgi:nicotinamide riboside kinase